MVCPESSPALEMEALEMVKRLVLIIGGTAATTTSGSAGEMLNRETIIAYIESVRE